MFLADVAQEMRRVDWPARSDALRNAVVVLVVVVLLLVIIGGLGTAFGHGLTALFHQ